MWSRDHLVARADVAGMQCELERSRSIVQADATLCADILSECILKSLDRRAEDELRPRDDIVDSRPALGRDPPMVLVEIE